MAQEIGTAYVTVQPSARGFGKAIEGEVGGGLEGANKRATSGLVSMAKKAAKWGTAAVLATGAAITGLAVKGGISRALNIEDAQAKLKGLGHDVQTVDQIMVDALASVKGTAYGLDAAATTAASAVAAGIKPGKELEAYLRLTADAATIAGVSMEEMGDIMNKVAAKGTVSAREINQFTERGIPILQMLADEYGVTAEAMSQMVSRGEVDAERFRKALEEGVGGAALASGDTTRGAFANMGAALSRLGLTVVEPFVANAKTLFLELTTIIDGLNALIGPFMSRFTEWFEKMIGPMEGFGKRTVGFFESLAARFSDGSLFGGFLDAVVSGIESAANWLSTGGIKSIADALMSGRETLTRTLMEVVPAVVNALVEIVPAIVDTVATTVGNLARLAPLVIEAAVDIFSGLVTGLLEVIPRVVSSIIGMIPTVVTAVTSALPQIVQAAMALFMGLVEGLSRAIPELLSAIVAAVPQVIRSLVGMLPVVVQGALELFSGITRGLVETVPEVVRAIVSAIPDIVGGLLGILPHVVSAAIELFTGLVTGFIEVLPQLIAEIVGMIPLLVGTLIALIPELMQASFELFFALVLGLIEATPAIIEALAALGPQLVTELVLMMPDILEASVDLFVQILEGLLENIPLILQGLTDLLPQMLETLTRMLPDMLKTGIELFMELVFAIIEVTPRIIKTLADLAPELTAAVIAMIPELFKAGGELYRALADAVPEIAPEILKAIAGLGVEIIKAITGIDLSGAGRDMMRGLAQGISNSVGFVSGAVRAAASTAVASMKAKLGISSPSRVFRDEIGREIVAGLALGISGDSRAVRASEGLAANVVDAFSGASFRVNAGVSGAAGGGRSDDVSYWDRVAEILAARIYEANYAGSRDGVLGRERLRRVAGVRANRMGGV